jgi:hypothetical protein
VKQCPYGHGIVKLAIPAKCAQCISASYKYILTKNPINHKLCAHSYYRVTAAITFLFKTLWHVDLLLGNDSEIGNYTIAVVKVRLRKQYFHGSN